MLISAILQSKGRDVVAVRPTDTIAAVVRLLAERRIGAALVQDAADQVLGILSERDIVRGLAEQGARTLEMTAGQLMTREVSMASPQTTVAQAMGMMTTGRFRHLPVMDGGHLAGLVSIGDIVKARLDEWANEVESLKAYVAGAA